MATTGEPLSDARLAEINGRLQNLDEMRAVGPRDFSDLTHAQLASIAVAYDTDMRDVLADNERLREREAALLAVVKSVWEGLSAIREVASATFQSHDADDTIIKVRPERAGWTISRMRLLLASTDKQARALLASESATTDAQGQE